MHATALRIVFTAAVCGAATSSVDASVGGLAQLTHVEGTVILHRAYAPAYVRAGIALADGDQLQTTNGRAEVTFRDGSILHIDRDTRVVAFARERFRVLDGRAVFRSSALSPAGYEVETDAARLRLMPRGVFGILAGARNRQLLLSVAVGDARVENRWGGTAVTARHMALSTGPTGRPFVSPYFPERTDGFETWSSARVLAVAVTARSGWRPADLPTLGPVVDHYRESSVQNSGWGSLPPWYWSAGSNYRRHAGDREGRDDWRRRRDIGARDDRRPGGHARRDSRPPKVAPAPAPPTVRRAKPPAHAGAVIRPPQA